MSKEVVFWLWGSNFTVVFGYGICKHLLALSKGLRKLRKLLTKELSSVLEMFTSSWRINRCCILKRQDCTNLDAKVVFFGTFANTLIFDAGTGTCQKCCCKRTIYVSFVQVFLWYFFKKWKKFAETGILFLTDIIWFWSVSFAKWFYRSCYGKHRANFGFWPTRFTHFSWDS